MINNLQNNYQPFSFTKIACTSCKLEWSNLQEIKVYAVLVYFNFKMSSQLFSTRETQGYSQILSNVGQFAALNVDILHQLRS